MFYCLVINEGCRKSRRTRSRLACGVEELRSRIGRMTPASRRETEASESGGQRESPECDNSKCLVAMRLGETPVHIPNTMVKT